MKLRKLFAWLMTLVMLLGMVPAAHAELAGCNHDWDWRFPNGEPTHCQEERLMEMYCTLCGQVASSYPVTGDHTPGSWQWDGTPPANCYEWGIQNQSCSVCGEVFNEREVQGEHQWSGYVTETPAGCETPGEEVSYCTVCGERGNAREIPPVGHDWGEWRWAHGEPACNSNGAWQVRECKRCGRMEDRWIQGGSHDMGEWYRNGLPTCTEEGLLRRNCQRCDYYETQPIPKVDHEFGEWYVVTEPEVGVPGLEQRDCTYGCGTYEQQEIPALEPAIALEGLELTLVLTSTPANGSYFVVGEEVTFTETWVNNTGKELYPFYVSIWTYPTPEYPGVPDIMCSWDAEETGPVAPGQSGSHQLITTVTEADVARGAIYAMAIISSTENNGKDLAEVTTPFVTAPCGEGTPDGVAGLTVDMTYTNTPANGSFFTPGEVIDYLITVTNTGSDTLTDLYVGNSSSEAVVPSPSEIAPGQTIQVPYYKLVYEGDAKAGGISSYGHANAFNGDPALPESLVSGRSADVFVPCGMGDGAPSVYYLKIVANAPANGLYFTEGETIKYRLSFGNNTKKDIYNITLNDPMANTRSVAFARRLKPGEFLMGEFEYVVTAADVAAGEIVNTATSTWATKAEGDQTKTPSNTVVTPCGSGVPSTGSIDAMLEKYVKNEPANGEYFVPGEIIEYAVIFMNTCPHELHDVEVYDPLKGSNEDITIVREPIVAPNGTLYLSFNYTVTEEDAARGTVVNTASALWLNPEIEEWSSCDSNTVTTLVGPAVSNDVAIIKTIENAPANGAYFVPGEVIQFAVTVQNNSAKTLDVVVLTDPLSADFFHELLDIPGGAMDSRPLSYTVTEFDAEIGFVINYAYAVVYVDDQPTSLTSNSVTALCGFPDKDGDGQPDDPYGIHAALEIVKSVESLPLNGSYYQEGETISYKITYTNIGEMPLTDVMIYDALGGMSEIATAETLTPGESRVCWFNHTVTADDVAHGHISNTAVGQFELGGYLNTVTSNTVVVDTDGKKDVWTGYPFWPGDDPDYDPGTGLIPDPTPEDKTPPFGSIDADQLHSGAASCVRTITDRDNVSINYEISFCANHADTQASVLAMMQVAVTPEMQLQTASYAVALWRAEVDVLYQEIFTAADSMAKATVMTEYIRFLTEVANYEALLKALHPDQPALAAKKIASMWEDKCVTLCYEMHTTTAQRKDSLLSVTPAAGAVASECACTTTDEVNGKKDYTQSYCPVHGFPFGMIDMLLQGQDTAEAWTMVRQIWSVELTNAYNKAAAKLGDNSALAMAAYNALTQWMAAREASLITLYPENPEVVAQTMVKLIMDRVNDLCQVTK